MNQKKIAAFFLALSIPVLTVGCSSAAEKVTEKATEKAIEKSGNFKDVDIDTKNQKVNIKTQEGEAEISASNSEGGVKIPEGFPEDFPIYEGSKVVSAVKTTDQGKENYTVTLETKDSPTQVMNYYKENFKKNGYGVSATMEFEQGGSLTVKKDGKDVGGIVISSDNSTTAVVCTYYK